MNKALKEKKLAGSINLAVQFHKEGLQQTFRTPTSLVVQATMDDYVRRVRKHSWRCRHIDCYFCQSNAKVIFYSKHCHQEDIYKSHKVSWRQRKLMAQDDAYPGWKKFLHAFENAYIFNLSFYFSARSMTFANSHFK